MRGIHGTHFGLKLVEREVARGLSSRSKFEGLNFGLSRTAVARDHGSPVFEVPIRWAPRETSNVALRRVALKSLYDLVRLGLVGRSHLVARREAR